MGSSVADLGGACGARPIESQEGLLGRPGLNTHYIYREKRTLPTQPIKGCIDINCAPLNCAPTLGAMLDPRCSQLVKFHVNEYHTLLFNKLASIVEYDDARASDSPAVQMQTRPTSTADRSTQKTLPALYNQRTDSMIGLKGLPFDVLCEQCPPQTIFVRLVTGNSGISFIRRKLFRRKPRVR